MAPKAKKKHGKSDDDALKEEALAEWLSRGLAVKDFTMDKMLKLWTDEDNDNESDSDDDDALADKQELLQSYNNVLGPVLEHAKEVASEIKDSAVAEAKHLWATAKRLAEIPPLKRRRLLREHVVHVRHLDAEATKYARIHERFVAAFDASANEHSTLEFGLKRRNNGRAPLLARFRELKRGADTEELTKQRDAREQSRQVRVDAVRQTEQRARDAKAQQAADALVQQRQQNATYWRKQMVEAKAFAAEHAQQRHDAKAAEANAKRELQHETDDMEDDDEEDDLGPIEAASTPLGVFDTALGVGAFASMAKGGGFTEGLDEHTVGVMRGTNAAIAEHELQRMELQEATSRIQILQQKLVQTSDVEAALTADRATLNARKDATLAEIKRLSDDHDALQRTLAGPPRRDASERDKRQFHTLVTRRAAQMQQLAALDARLAATFQRSQLAVRTKLSFVAQLAAVKERNATLQAAVDAIDAARHELPMVVGRSIFQPSGSINANTVDDLEGENAAVTVLQTDPTALLARVTLQSKFALLQHAAAPVDTHVRAAKRLAAQRSQLQAQQQLAQHELDATMTRLADVRDRVVDQQRTSVRADLVHAIARFHQSGTKLRRCIFPLTGVVDWWHQRLVRKTSGVCCSNSRRDGTRMLYLNASSSHTRGELYGSVRLPKRCRYRIELTITMQRVVTSDDDAIAAATLDETIDSSDVRATTQQQQRLQLFVGSDFDALHEHLFSDVSDNVRKQQPTGTLSFEFFGSRLCYCFAFRAATDSNESPQLTLVLASTGAFEERLDDFRDEAEHELELQQRETHFVSELVATLRLQAKQTSSARCTDLLEELLAVERSAAKTFDSALLHGYMQRFARVAYASLLRTEIRNEVTQQIDDDVRMRQTRGVADRDVRGDEEEDSSGQRGGGVSSSTEASRLHFLARKAALVEPQLRKAADALGAYCSFKAPTDANGDESSTKRSESIVLGQRLEWREGKSTLRVTHKLCTGSIAPAAASSIVDTEWRSIETANAVFLASAFPKALAQLRADAAATRALATKQQTQLVALQRETQQTQQLERAAIEREQTEDALLKHQRTHDLARRRVKLFADAIRLTTYNESISSQIDFHVQRRVNALEQQAPAVATDDSVGSAIVAVPTTSAATTDAIVRDVKTTFATHYVDGRLALANKTWERKEKRIADVRERARRERAFAIHQEQQRAAAIVTDASHELAALQQQQRDAHTKLQQQLVIPHFRRAVSGAFECEHRAVKSWGSTYDTGQRCKQCGKEMAASFDDVDHTRGADAALDRDVEAHRDADAGGGVAMRFQSASHLAAVESERMRLEKEARAMQLTDALLYDRMHPKAIAAFNFRHNLDRSGAATGSLSHIAGSHELYARVVGDAHRALFHDDVLFHGRLRNFGIRLAQIDALYVDVTMRLAVQRDFLENVAIENAFVMEQLPLVERDHARAVRLLDEDAAASAAYDAAKCMLTAAQREREAARHAIDGVDEDAEFAELHVPALVQSSDAMQAVVDRMTAEHAVVAANVTQCDAQLVAALNQRAATDGMLERLRFRTRGTVVRTPFGVASVQYVREADDCVVLTSLHWRGTFYIPLTKLTAFEALFCEDESVAMGHEEQAMRAFIAAERQLERRECALLAEEDALVQTITAWRCTKQQEETIVRDRIEHTELTQQLEYEMDGRKQLREVATREAAHLHTTPRVSLVRRRRLQPANSASRLGILRVTRASEKRLAMAAVESAPVGVDTTLGQTFVRDRDALFAATLAQQVLDELCRDVLRELCSDVQRDERGACEQLERALNTAIVRPTNGATSATDDAWQLVCSRTRLGFDRLWVARKATYTLLRNTWEREAAKLTLLQNELARRDAIDRRVEAERLELEARRQAMQNEERWCRQFYVDEVVLCMRERKAMASAELEMREYERQLSLETMQTKYADMVADRNSNTTSDKGARRLEIKLGKNEKHRLHREWAVIQREDTLATQVRTNERAVAQAAALERQLDRFLVQQALDGQHAAAREASRLVDRMAEAKRLAIAQRAAFDAQLNHERMVATVAAFSAVASAEVAWMHAVERSAYWLQRLAPLATNLRILVPELARILQERVHVVANAQLKRQHADACHARLAAATTALESASRTEDACAKQYKRIHVRNATIDSDVLHGRTQRFTTSYLRQQLHTQYFRLLTESIVRQAIVQSSECTVARLKQQLESLDAERRTKRLETNRLKRKHRRAGFMQLRRAELGKLLFGASQQHVLRSRFQQWVALWSQRVAVRASFELKHSLLLHEHKLHKNSSAVPTLSSSPNHRSDTPPGFATTKLSVLHNHQQRRQVCRLCQREYSDEQNNRFACAYHPEAYAFACVRSCASRCAGPSSTGVANANTVMASCMLHRAKRWLCCDETDEGRFGSNGCARRYHMPTRGFPALTKLVDSKAHDETMRLTQLDSQLLELRDRNVVGHVKSSTKAVISSIEKELASKRASAAKYHALDKR